MTEIVEGGAIRAGERELVPLVRVTTGVRRQAFVGADRVAGRGWGLARLRPVAILERSETGERRFPIRDRTAEVLGGFLLAAFVVWLLLAVAVRVARRT
jgi:hypothetical protein